MRILNPEPGLSALEVAEIELILGIEFPPAVRSLYLSTNGGEPEPYVFENSNFDTVVAEFLPLKSNRKGTAVSSYGRTFLDKLPNSGHRPGGVESLLVGMRHRDARFGGKHELIEKVRGGRFPGCTQGGLARHFA
jgi:hypothetical protein